MTWGPPKTILSPSVWGDGVAMVTMDQVRVSPDGNQWLLAVNSLGSGDAVSSARGGLMISADGGGLVATGVLSSTDRGASWQLLPGRITDIANVTHFQEPTLEFCGNNTLIILFRTEVGVIYKALSHDRGVTWGPSVPTTMPNPNSRVNLLARRDSPKELLLAYNPSTRDRSPLVLARSTTCGETWETIATLYEGHGGYPTMTQSGEYVVTTFTRDSKTANGGIGAAVMRLPPPLA